MISLSTAYPKTRLSREGVAWLYLAPTLILFFILVLWPLYRTVHFSFTDATLSNLTEFEYIGLLNYFEILSDSEWWTALKNTLIFTFTSVTLEVVLGIYLALGLNKAFPGRQFFRALILIPWLIPTVVSAKIWAWMLHDMSYGIINTFLLFLGLIDSPMAWTAESPLNFISMIMVDVWKTTPFVTILVLAALQMVPKDCYEAAKIDASSSIKTFFYITLPFIRPALIVAIIFRGLDSLRVFDVIYVLFGTNSDTMSISIYARQHLIDFQNTGYGSALSICIFITLMLLTVVYIKFSKLQMEVKK